MQTRILRIGQLLLVCLLLVGCFPSNPEEKYREAIAAVEGVEDVSVEWHRNGVGDSTTPSDLGVVLRTLGEIRRY